MKGIKRNESNTSKDAGRNSQSPKLRIPETSFGDSVKKIENAESPNPRNSPETPEYFGDIFINYLYIFRR